MKTARGHITLVQEERFRLMTADGQSYLFTVHHGAAVGADELQRYRRDHVPVEVQYDGEPGLESGVAHAVAERSA